MRVTGFYANCDGGGGGQMDTLTFEIRCCL